MNKFFLMGVLIALAYLAGRFSAPESEKLKKENQTLITENSELNRQLKENIEKLRDFDRQKVTTIIEQKDGTKITRIDDRAKMKSSSQSSKETIESLIASKETLSKTKEEKEIVNRKGAIGQIMIGLDPFNLQNGFDAGAALTLPLAGPFYFGPWAFLRPDFKIGVSLGFGF